MIMRRRLPTRLAIVLSATACAAALTLGPAALPTAAAWIDGTPGDDVLDGTDEADQIWALAGDDIVRGHGGDDQLWGMEGNDEIYGGDGDDHAVGGEGDDYIEGGR